MLRYRRLRHSRWLVLALMLVGLGGCGDGTPEPPGANRLVNYTCADSTKVTALFGLDPSAMQLRIDGKSQNLELQQGLATTQYADKGTVFTINGAEAQLQRPGKSQTSCKIGV